MTLQLHGLNQVTEFFLGVDSAVFGGLGQAEGGRGLAVADFGLIQNGVQGGRLNLSREARQADQANA